MRLVKCQSCLSAWDSTVDHCIFRCFTGWNSDFRWPKLPAVSLVVTTDSLWPGANISKAIGVHIPSPDGATCLGVWGRAVLASIALCLRKRIKTLTRCRASLPGKIVIARQGELCLALHGHWVAHSSHRLIKKRHPGGPMERKCKSGWLPIREKTLLTSADKCADNLGIGINHS